MFIKSQKHNDKFPVVKMFKHTTSLFLSQLLIFTRNYCEFIRVDQKLISVVDRQHIIVVIIITNNKIAIGIMIYSCPHAYKQKHYDPRGTSNFECGRYTRVKRALVGTTVAMCYGF